MHPLILLAFIVIPLIFLFLYILRELKFRSAFTFLRKGNFKQALKIFEDNVADKSHQLSAYWGLAKTYQGLRQFEPALQSLKKIPLTQTGSSQYFTTLEYYTLLSELLRSLKRHEEAIKYLLYIQEKFGDTAAINQKIGECFFEMKDTRKAFHYLNMAMEKGSGVETMVLLGVIYYRLGNFEECLNILKKAVKNQPTNKTARVYLGFTFYRLKRYSQALSFLKQVTPEVNDENMYFWIIGSSAFHANDFGSAYGYLQKFLTYASFSSQEYREALFDLAHSAEQIGKFEEASTIWEKLFLIDPMFPGVSQRFKLSRHYLTSSAFKNYLFSPRETFMGLVEVLLEKMHYMSKFIIEQNDWSLCYVVSTEDAPLPFGKKVVLFIRSADPAWIVDDNVLEKCLNVMRKESAESGEIYTVGLLANNIADFARMRKISLKGLDDVAALLAQGD